MPSTAPACKLLHANEASALLLKPLLSLFSKCTAHPARGSPGARRTTPSTPAPSKCVSPSTSVAAALRGIHAFRISVC
jgi:hypothetical protein